MASDGTFFVGVMGILSQGTFLGSRLPITITITITIAITIAITITITIMPPTLEGDMDLGEREEEALSSDFRFMKIDLWIVVRL